MKRRICPKCEKFYCDYPAISRADSKTQICPDCGIMEALENTIVSEQKMSEIINAVHKFSQKKKGR